MSKHFPVSVLVLGGILGNLILANRGWADFEVYRKKGFAIVPEILEKKSNGDGTFTVKARRSRTNSETVEFDDVVEIKETKPSKGLQLENRILPTPTPVFVKATQPVHSKKSEVEKYPVLQKFLSRFQYLFIGGVALVLLLFIVVRVSS